MTDAPRALILVVEGESRIRTVLKDAATTLNEPVVISVSSVDDAMALLNQWRPMLVIVDADQEVSVTKALRRVVKQCEPALLLIEVARMPSTNRTRIHISDLVEAVRLICRRRG